MCDGIKFFVEMEEGDSGQIYFFFEKIRTTSDAMNDWEQHFLPFILEGFL